MKLLGGVVTFLTQESEADVKSGCLCRHTMRCGSCYSITSSKRGDTLILEDGGVIIIFLSRGVGGHCEGVVCVNERVPFLGGVIFLDGGVTFLASKIGGVSSLGGGVIILGGVSKKE